MEEPWAAGGCPGPPCTGFVAEELAAELGDPLRVLVGPFEELADAAELPTELSLAEVTFPLVLGLYAWLPGLVCCWRWGVLPAGLSLPEVTFPLVLGLYA